MDFDELDELAPVKESRQPPTGSVLDWVRRSNQLPGLCSHLHLLPDGLQKQLPPHVLKVAQSGRPGEPTAKVRLICIHGVADSYKQEWFLLEAQAPPEVEVVVYEFPGHGHREREKVPSSIKELTDDAFEALREVMETGSFALLGHSIGCLAAVELAKRAQAELNVKPVAVFMVERGACQWPLFTDKGLRSLHDINFSITLALEPRADRSLELRVKELEGGSGKDASLLVDGVSVGPLRDWNAVHAEQEVRLLDEIVGVDGESGFANDLHDKLSASVDSDASCTLKLDLRRRPYDFLKIHQPTAAMMFISGPTRALDRWSKTWLCENDTLDVGYFQFSCPFLALCAEYSIDGRRRTRDLQPEALAVVEFGGKVFNKEVDDGHVFLGHFPRSTFDDWREWTENTDAFSVVECNDCDHMTIKASKRFKDTVFGTLVDLVKLWSRS